MQKAAHQTDMCGSGKGSRHKKDSGGTKGIPILAFVAPPLALSSPDVDDVVHRDLLRAQLANHHHASGIQDAKQLGADPLVPRAVFRRFMQLKPRSDTYGLRKGKERGGQVERCQAIIRCVDSRADRIRTWQAGHK